MQWLETQRRLLGGNECEEFAEFAFWRVARLLVLSLFFPHPAKRVQIPQKVIVKYTVAACTVVFLTSFNGLRIIWLQEVKTHLNYLKKGVCRPVGGRPLELVAWRPARCPGHQRLFSGCSSSFLGEPVVLRLCCSVLLWPRFLFRLPLSLKLLVSASP